jgi:hypothetical protein
VTDVHRLGSVTAENLGAPPLLTQETDYVAAGVLYGPPPMPAASAGAPARSEGSAAPASAWPPGAYGIDYFFPGDPDHRARHVVVEIKTPLNSG